MGELRVGLIAHQLRAHPESEFGAGQVLIELAGGLEVIDDDGDTGPEHVGIGLDYDPADNVPGVDKATSDKYWPARQYPGGIETTFLPPSVLPQVARQLRSRGYKEQAVRDVMGGNFMRVASQVWAK